MLEKPARPLPPILYETAAPKSTSPVQIPETARRALPKSSVMLKADCANCGMTFIARRISSAFCCQQCRDEAKFVRFLRKEIASAGEFEPEAPSAVVEALRTKMHWALKGGYSVAVRTISAADRKAVIKRDGGRCVNCGEPGKEIDHLLISQLTKEFGTVARLQLLCKKCHRDITIRHRGFEGGSDAN